MIDKIVEKINNFYPQPQADKIIEAYDYARKAHEGQLRASGEKYFVHPCSVGDILIDLGLDYHTIMAALLHDVIEDTLVEAGELTKIFGEEVARLVEGVTKLDRLKFKTQEDEQAENLRKMLLAMADDIRVIIIKLADRLHNMRTLSFKAESRQKAIAKETLEIYAPIAARLGISNVKCELEDLAMRYLNADVYYELAEKISTKRKERHKFVDLVVKQIEEKLVELEIVGEVNGRPKHFYSIYKKMQAGRSFEEIYDLTAVRVIVDSIKDCYSVLGAIHNMWKPLPGRFKDYIAMPKPNRYQSLHTTVITSYGSPFEIQIRTKEMHRVAEYGIAAHWKYKEGVSESNVQDDRLTWIREVMEVQKETRDNREFLDSLKLDLYTDQVFVFTPKGDVLNLPQGSIGVDFAYNVHSAVGNKCVGIKIDGKIVPLNTVLENGNIVEVITSNSSKGPSRDWLKMVKTPSAKSKIRAFFKKEMKEENIKRGKQMLEREAKHRGYNLGELISNDKWIKYIDQRYGIRNIDDLFSAVGYGDFTSNRVIVKLIDFFKKDMVASPQILEIKPQGEEKRKNKERGILIKGFSDFVTRLSHCCSPVPGDEIVGYISRGRGVSIHRIDCPNLKSVESERLIEAHWPQGIQDKFVANVDIFAFNRSDLLFDITSVASTQKLTVVKLNARIEKNDVAIINLGIEITDIKMLDKIIEKLRCVSGVDKVVRASGDRRDK